MTWLWWAPLGAAALHIVEEFVFPGGFAEWDRVYRPAFRGSITSGLHVVVNALLLGLCATVGLAGMGRPGVALGAIHLSSGISPRLAPAAWLAVAALLASNAVFHLVGAVRTKRYSPGMATGALLYLPLAAYGFAFFLRGGAVSAATAALAALIGGSYHLWASLLHRSRARTAGSG